MSRSPEGPSRAGSSPPEHARSQGQFDEATFERYRKAVELRERLLQEQYDLWHDGDGRPRKASDQEVQSYIRNSERAWYGLVKELIGADAETRELMRRRILG